MLGVLCARFPPREANINIKDKGLRYTDPGQIQVSAFYPIVIRHPPEDENAEVEEERREARSEKRLTQQPLSPPTGRATTRACVSAGPCKAHLVAGVVGFHGQTDRQFIPGPGPATPTTLSHAAPPASAHTQARVHLTLE